MAEVAQIYLGNIDQNHDLAELVARETCLKVCLKQSDRQKGRIHTYINEDLAVGIVKSRDRFLQSGDVFQTESGKLLLVHIQEQKLLVLDLSNLQDNVAATELVRLGHILGNHHYGIAIQNKKVYVKINTEPKIIDKTIADLQIPGLQITYEMHSPQDITLISHSH